MSDILKLFRFHNCDITEPNDDDNHAWGECPFCQHPRRKWSINLASGLWDCKHCGRSGNPQTFLSQLHELCLEETTDDDYRRLADQRRGIPWQLFRDHQFAIDHSYEEPRWLIPIYSSSGGISSLRAFDPGHPVTQTAGTHLALWRFERIQPDGPVFICEGEWDALALEHLRQSSKQLGSVLAVPGAASFKREWLNYFLRRDVYICFDNDEAGIRHSQLLAKKLESFANNVYRLDWPETTDTGFDIRDYAIQFARSPKNAFNDLLRCMVRTGGRSHQELIIPPGAKLPPRKNFRGICREFDKAYRFDSNLEETLALMFAVIFSCQIASDPLWLFIVGPPGCGKTLLLKSVQDSHLTVYRSSITAKALVSGFNVEPDPSLLADLNNKCLIVKDYTEITSLLRAEQDEIYGIFRGAYDGRVERSYGNGVFRNYNPCYFSMLAGVTDVIHGDNRASLGERFLKFQMVDGSTHNPYAQIRSAIHSMAEESEVEHRLRGIVSVFLDRKISDNDLPRPSDLIVERVIALVQIIAVARALVERDRNNDPLFRPSVEVGSRLGKQLIKLAQCLSLVYESSEITPKIFNLVTRVALDTGRGWSLDLLQELAAQSDPITIDELHTLADVPRSTANRRILDLRMFKAVDAKTSSPTGGRGRPRLLYSLSPRFRELWNAAFPPGKPRSPKRKKS